jgi:hypothetical protein
LEQTHPAATGHLPGFITSPGQTDYLFVVTMVLLVGIVLLIGNFYLRLHALPEQMAHRTKKVQMEIVAVLALIALFTHNHLFWIAALLLAFVEVPDFSTPISSMARSLEKIARDRTLEERQEDRQWEPIQADLVPAGPEMVPEAKLPTEKPQTQG